MNDFRQTDLKLELRLKESFHILARIVRRKDTSKLSEIKKNYYMVLIYLFVETFVFLIYI